jgi:hypothetical protein
MHQGATRRYDASTAIANQQQMVTSPALKLKIQ